MAARFSRVNSQETCEQAEGYSNVQSKRALLPTEERHAQYQNHRSQNEVNYRDNIQNSSFWQKTGVIIRIAAAATTQVHSLDLRD